MLKVYLDNVEIDKIVKEINKRCKIILKNNTILTIKECKNKEISFICPICNKVTKSKFSVYKLHSWTGNKKTPMCYSCEQRRNPRKHIWTIEERQQRKELYSGSKNPFYGKKHSEITKQIIKNKRKNQIITQETKDKIRIFWQNHPEIIKENIKKAIITKSKWSQEQIDTYHNNLKLGAQKAKLTPNYIENKRKAGHISKFSYKSWKMNNFEKIVNDWLLCNNIAFNYSAIMSDKNNNTYQFDFIIPDKKILIECQGTYWHGDERFFNIDGSNNKRKLNNIQISKQKTDIIKRKFAKEHNFILIELWEYDIINLNDFSKLEEIL